MAARFILALILVFQPGYSAPCYGLGSSSASQVVLSFAPSGQYAGHWGVDIVAPVGSAVRALGSGTVTFAGPVAGRLSVTVNHGGEVRTSYSYLTAVSTTVGKRVTRGSRVGISGLHGGTSAFHLSLRLGKRYLDPLSLRRCSEGPGPGLWLSPVIARYPG